MQVKKLLSCVLLVSAPALLFGCSGDGKDGIDGQNGSSGVNGTDGINGASGVNGSSGLVVQTLLNAGNSQCFKGGLQIDTGVDTNANTILELSEITSTNYLCDHAAVNSTQNFKRIASFAACSQIDTDCDTDTETSAEIIAASTDGMTLIYTNSPNEDIGFVDIANPNLPQALGTLAMAGEPTSVAVKDNYALVAVNVSADFVNVAGHINVVHIGTQASIRTLDLGGQPDSISVSPDGNYALVAIENERDENLGDGYPGQAPAGFLVIVNLSDTDPANWTTSMVDVTGIADLYGSDPEPEFVDINSNNIAVVTMQENNHIVLVDLTTGNLINNFSAGSVDLIDVDTSDDRPAIIDPSQTQDARLREPDGVSWINTEYFATANEGDLDGGSRGFSVFNLAGDVVWDSGANLDHLAIRLGHYPDKRSDAKGNEPENIEMGVFGNDRYLFINSERSSLVFVYDVADPKNPIFKQALPAAVAPEGGLAITSRNLLVVASEADSRADVMRSAVNIYTYNYQALSYPSIQSVNRENGLPIPWSAISGLSADAMNNDILYAVNDSFFASNRIFTLDVSAKPATITTELAIMDSNDIFATLTTSGAVASDDSFDDADLAALINADKTVNIDPEGIAKASDGGFWIASEGAGTIGDTANRPIEKLNWLFKTDSNGVIEHVITLPTDINAKQVRFGFEGVAEYNGKVFVAFQRAWVGETYPRIGIYDVANTTWEFVFYPLDAVASQNGGWVGLSDITSIGDGKFLIIERDNQGGPDAAIKRLYQIDLASYVDGNTVTKVLVRDLMADLAKAGGLVPEKIEGSALLPNGDVYIVNDNDGVDDNSGETQLINLGTILTN